MSKVGNTGADRMMGQASLANHLVAQIRAGGSEEQGGQCRVRLQGNTDRRSFIIVMGRASPILSLTLSLCL